MKNKKLAVLTEAGMMIALAMALSQFRPYTLPGGGSVSLTTLPILIFSARHKVKFGCMAGLITGLLIAATHPIIVHPVQFLLDYVLAYMSLGLAGIFKWETPLKAVSATIIAHFFKLTCHTVAGAVFFIKNKDSVKAILSASAIYNASHVVPEAIICSVIAAYLTAYHNDLVNPANG